MSTSVDIIYNIHNQKKFNNKKEQKIYLKLHMTKGKEKEEKDKTSN